jgi:hypothetical protein
VVTVICLAVRTTDAEGAGLPSAFKTTPLMAPVLSCAFTEKAIQLHRMRKATILFIKEFAGFGCLKNRRENISVQSKWG